MSRARSNLVGINYAKFENIDNGDYSKNSLLGNELKQYVPLEYMKEDFDYTFKNGKSNIVPSNQGAMYIIFSHAKNRDILQPVCSEAEHFKIMLLHYRKYSV